MAPDGNHLLLDRLELDIVDRDLLLLVVIGALREYWSSRRVCLLIHIELVAFRDHVKAALRQGRVRVWRRVRSLPRRPDIALLWCGRCQIRPLLLDHLDVGLRIPLLVRGNLGLATSRTEKIDRGFLFVDPDRLGMIRLRDCRVAFGSFSEGARLEANPVLESPYPLLQHLDVLVHAP